MLDWGWLATHIGAFADRTWQHLYLAAFALAIGFAIAFALGLWAVRRPRVYPPVAGLAGIVYTIPSLALFAALIPITGITLVTAEVPLILYTQVIFIRNIVGGFNGVPDDVLEAADGMGYAGRQRLWRVELPLAIPVIVAGLRVASVSTIGLVTISGTLGDRFGGLGFFIFEGYSRSFATEMFAGAGLSIALALLVDALLVRSQRRLTPWARAGARGADGSAA
ncbi:MAG: ABC transporter permease [Candidatus Limnocylindrales bacterium]